MSTALTESRKLLTVEMELIGKYDAETKQQWRLYMDALATAGLLEADFDVIHADLIFRTAIKAQRLDEIAHDVLMDIANPEANTAVKWYEREVAKLHEYVASGRLNGKDFAGALFKLNEAMSLRITNSHNLLNILEKAKFQNLQIFNKGSVYAAFARDARKKHGSGGGHEMEKLAKVLAEEVDELNISAKPTGAFVEAFGAVSEAEYSEEDAVKNQQMLNEIRTPLAVEGAE